MMGDKSPKAKQRNQKQKDTAKAGNVAAARDKQAAQKFVTDKGKK
jgi:hypothetical protein